MGIRMEQLIANLRLVGSRYLADIKPTMFARHDRNAAIALEKLLLRVDPQISHEKNIQQILLVRMCEIVEDMQFSGFLLINMKDVLLEYDPFKPLINYLPEQTSLTTNDMATALACLIDHINYLNMYTGLTIKGYSELDDAVVKKSLNLIYDLLQENKTANYPEELAHYLAKAPINEYSYGALSLFLEQQQTFRKKYLDDQTRLSDNELEKLFSYFEALPYPVFDKAKKIKSHVTKIIDDAIQVDQLTLDLVKIIADYDTPFTRKEAYSFFSSHDQVQKSESLSVQAKKMRLK